MPRASVNRLRLTPPLPRSVGLGPVFFSAQRRFVQRTVEGHPVEVEANQVLIVLQRDVPEPGEDPGLYPLLKPGVGRGTGADTRGAQCLPLAASAQHEENAIEHLPVWHALFVAAQGVGLWNMDR